MNMSVQEQVPHFLGPRKSSENKEVSPAGLGYTKILGLIDRCHVLLNGLPTLHLIKAPEAMIKQRAEGKLV